MNTSSSQNTDETPELSEEDRAIVEKGRALLQSLKGKPLVSKELQSRAGDGIWDDPEDAKAAGKDADADKPLL